MRKQDLDLLFVLLIFGVVSLAIENHFYQYIDENGYLKESFFLPLGAISLFLGSVGSVGMASVKIWTAFRSK